MGAWGTGPFDSDGALDYLGDLQAFSGAARNGADEVDPATVDRVVVQENLRRALAATGELGGREWVGCQELTYAAAGLVAARLSGRPSANTGTGLIVDISAGQAFPEDLGLDRHCGYLGLLDQHTAQQLQTAARQAVAALRADQSWHSEWNRPAHLVTQLDRLVLILAPSRHLPREPDREPEAGP